MGEVKYELVLPLPHRGGEELAVSSFNLHRDFYSGVYKIHLAGGATAETACVGFGLERWLYGFVSQKGSSPKPVAVASQRVCSNQRAPEKARMRA